MMPKRPQKIEIEKEHPDLLLLGSQAVTTKCPNFLGTALIDNEEFTAAQADSFWHRLRPPCPF
jgi:hypothetical protein